VCGPHADYRRKEGRKEGRKTLNEKKRTNRERIKSSSSSFSSPGHEVRPINDLFRPHDCVHQVKIKVKGKVVPVLN
jgi:hypothetical protein